MIKVTFTLDEASVAYLERASERLGVAKSRFVREAIRSYGEQMAKLSAEERGRMLRVFDDVTSEIPARPRTDVDEELGRVRRARREGGRAPGGGAGA